MLRLSLMGRPFWAFAAIWATWAFGSASSQAESNLQFYMHDNVLVRDASVIQVAGPNGSTTTFGFGSVMIIDDPLTEGPSPTSRALGRGQGTYMDSTLDSSSLLLTFTAVFSDRNGTLSFHGADKISVSQREIAVVGGTGIYRFAHGYAVITTYSTMNFSAILHFDVTVQLPNVAGLVGAPGQSSSIAPTSLGLSSSAVSVIQSSLSCLLFFGVVIASLLNIYRCEDRSLESLRLISEEIASTAVAQGRATGRALRAVGELAPQLRCRPQAVAAASQIPYGSRSLDSGGGFVRTEAADGILGNASHRVSIGLWSESLLRRGTLWSLNQGRSFHVAPRLEAPLTLSPKEFTNMAWQAIVGAVEVAQASKQQVVETEHLLKALLEQKSGLARRIFTKTGVDNTALLQATERFIQRQPKVSGNTSGAMVGQNLEALLDRAKNHMKELGDSYLSIEHLVLAAAEDDRCGKELLSQFGMTTKSLRDAVVAIRGSQKVTDQAPENKYEALEKYGQDLTELARQGKLDPVIGRDDEIRRCIQILCRRTKNNPVVIGEPGVGKTAIAEGLAQRIIQGDVPEALANRKLISLDLGALIAGAKFQGEFEDRLKAVLKEVKDSEGYIVLFIDEIHMVVGAGATSGAMDAGNLLKPMLGRGELRCIGATTLKEYRKYIEKDAALERRFQQVYIAQPSVEDTISILRGLREKYELHHGVKISDNALVEAAMLGERYISDRFLPDKAIDLVDEAAAKLKMEMTSKPTALDEIDRSIIKLEMERLSLQHDTDKASRERLQKLEAELASLKEKQKALAQQWESEKSIMTRINSFKEEIDRVNIEIQQAERDYDLNRAAELKYGVLINLQKQLDAAEKELADYRSSEKTMLREVVTADDIAEIVSKWTGIPVSRLLQSEMEKLLQLDDHLHKRIIGQNPAVQAVADAIRRSRAGLADPNRPIASFMFMGPTGVGKTELAKALAEYLFDTEHALVRYDMSEYMEKHAVSRLIGAPPGYVGYEEGGQLTESVRRRPYSVVLFDEIEKAHADVFNIFLQILDDGRVTDSQGRTVNFSNTVVIMTSNLGSQHILASLKQPGDKDAVYEAMKNLVMEVARSTFRPEFMNRVDEFIVFQPLDIDQIHKIVKLQLQNVEKRLQYRKISFKITDEAVDHFAKLGYDPNYGARPVKRVIQQYVTNELAKGILKGDFKEEDTILITTENVSGQTKLVMRKWHPQYDDQVAVVA